MSVATVYVRLLGEGTDVFRPTQAECMPNGLFTLRATANYDPDDEHWEFAPGQVVKCRRIKLSGGLQLVAVALA
jgi:archaellum component FlaG (FlaF/FlaG flagellin family)